MSLVAPFPGLVCQGIDESTAVISLIKGYCQEADLVTAWPPQLPIIDACRSNAGHYFFGLKSSMQKPETRH
jgi:hypothetical protein